MPHKFENARVLPLMLAKGFVIHKEIDDMPAAIDGVDPGGEFVGGKRPLAPVCGLKTETRYRR